MQVSKLAKMARMNSLKLSVAALLCAASLGFINPAFTPVDLVKQSDMIVYLKIKGVDAKNMATATVTKVVKGKLEEKEIKIDFDTFVPADGIDVVAHIKNGDTDAVMFVGMFQQDEEDGGNGKAATEAKGFLAIAGKWVTLEQDKKGENGLWDMQKTDDHMNGTWAGGTDMLFKVVDYVLGDPTNARLPTSESVDWDKESKLGKLDGKIYAAAPVDLKGDGKLDLFITGEKGDHLLHWTGKAFEDETEKLTLNSKSEFFVWGDFNGDGRVDLASSDGKTITIYSQSESGAFTAGKPLETGDLMKAGIVGLTTFDSGDPAQKGRPVILASTHGSPVALTIQNDGSASTKALLTAIPANFNEKEFGEPAECLVADFDNDGLPDIVQLGSRSSFFYKGTKPGEFAAPVRLNMGCGQGRHGVCVGDWDADGLLDIFTCAEDGVHLWHNGGEDKFADSVARSGSVAYIGKSGGIFAQTTDFIGDGRQGLFMLYSPQLAPQLFFNRGFRSFGLCRRLEGEEKAAVPEALQGQQAGCMADLTGQGAPGMVLVLLNGEVWFFPQKLANRTMGVNVSLSTASPNAGPVKVWASNATRPFGAAVIRAGEPGMFFGSDEPAAITVKWQFPGGEIQQKVVKTKPDNGVVRVVIDKVVAKAAENK